MTRFEIKYEEYDAYFIDGEARGRTYSLTTVEQQITVFADGFSETGLTLIDGQRAKTETKKIRYHRVIQIENQVFYSQDFDLDPAAYMIRALKTEAGIV